MAAFAVVFQHARGLVMVDYSPGVGIAPKLVFFATGFAHQAVVIFFVLSGALVGRIAIQLICKRSSSEQRRRFAADRLSRITIVLWPALALSALIALASPSAPVLTTAGWSADLPNIGNASPLSSWFATAVLLNEILIPTVPYNGPLWSLAYEWTYYVIAAATIFLSARDRTALGVGIIAYGIVLLALSVWAHPKLVWMMSFWLAGVVASQVTRWRQPVVSVALFLLTLFLSRFDAFHGFEDAAVAAATAILIADRSFRDGRFGAYVGAWLASFSFSLYAVHWPVMLFYVALAQRFGYVHQRLEAGPIAYLTIAGLVIMAYCAAIAFAWGTEWRTEKLRAWVARYAEARAR